MERINVMFHEFVINNSGFLKTLESFGNAKQEELSNRLFLDEGLVAYFHSDSHEVEILEDSQVDILFLRITGIIRNIV